jgi:hypothetical protein
MTNKSHFEKDKQNKRQRTPTQGNNEIRNNAKPNHLSKLHN